MRAGVLPRLARDRRNWFVLPPIRREPTRSRSSPGWSAETLEVPDDWRGWRRPPTASDECARELERRSADRYRTHPRHARQHPAHLDRPWEELFTVTTSTEAERFSDAACEAEPLMNAAAFSCLWVARRYLDVFQQAAEGKVRYESFWLGPIPPARWRTDHRRARAHSRDPSGGRASSAPISDANTDDALPLLAFTLRELYSVTAGRKSGRRIPSDSF